MKISDRITSVEVKLRYIEKLLYIIIIGLGGNLGFEYLPVVSALIP